MGQEDRGPIGDLGDLASEQIREVEKVLDYLITIVQADSLESVALLIIGTEFKVSQAKADAWATYQSMKANEARVRSVRVASAMAEGVLEGRNAEERKRKESVFNDTDPDIALAKSNTVAVRNMSDCLSNAHSSINNALNLIMGMVQRENT